MAEINWTDEQKLAIQAGAGDILLTAAAGAGKTAVLAQRCIYLLTEAPGPCNIDELLVLTYTTAAAAEMRRRIGSALYERIRLQPGNTSLRRQLSLLDNACVSTIHSFCRSVLGEFFYCLGLDPNFEILDADEADLLKRQIARELLEDYYARLGGGATWGDFCRLAQSFGSGSDDRSLIHLLIRLHNFLDHLRDHQGWIKNCRQQLQDLRSGDVMQLALVQNQKRMLQRQIDRISCRLQFTAETVNYFPELNFYLPYIKGYLLPLFAELQAALAGDDFAGALGKLDQIKRFSNAPTRPKELGAEDVAPVKELIDLARDDFRKARESLSVAADEVLRQVTATAGEVDLLINLHDEFGRRYQQIKQQEAVLDFSDLEHLCLQLLEDEGRASEVALQLRNRYRYILVDEYQDISPVQEAILQYVSRRGCDDGRVTTFPTEGRGYLFMVGDVKQSIYGFRQADPEIFLDKYKRFAVLDLRSALSPKAPAQNRIDLNTNFRSRRSLIDAVNYIFSRCMTAEFTGIDYRRDAQLVYGARFYDAFEKSNNKSVRAPVSPAELHFIERQLPDISLPHPQPENNNASEEENSADTADINQLDAIRREAVIIGRRIRRLVGVDEPEGKAEFDIIDPDSGDLRPVAYRDVVILLRSMKMRAELFSEVFAQMKIPVHAELSSGYFVATEIQDMISLLKLLDNPQQDIPLASVLRSPLAGLNESQLAAIRLYSPDGPYYFAVTRYAESGDLPPLKQQLIDFLGRLENWRTIARRGGLASLIWQIYRDTNLLAYVSGLGDGRQRYSNLLHLYDRARQYDTFAGGGLGRFLVFMEKLREEEGDLGPACVLTAADNVVRIMSVHKSKGLEFPVVIVADLAHQFNKRDAADPVLFDRDPTCPVGFRLVDVVSRDCWPTVAHHLAAGNIQQRFLAEEMRILYVALTRARERLILTASIDLGRRRCHWGCWRFHTGRSLPEFILAAANTPIDWLGPALASHPDMQNFFNEDVDAREKSQKTSPQKTPARFAVSTYSGVRVAALLAAAQLNFNRPEPPGNPDDLITWEKSPALSAEAQAIVNRINWRYPHRALTELPARRSVTELKHQIDAQSDPDFACDRPTPLAPDFSDSGHFNIQPRFLSAQPAPPAAEVGVWTHLFLQRLDPEQPLDEASLRKQLKQLVHQGVFTDHQGRHILITQVARFFADRLGRRLRENRKTMRREWPFTVALAAHQAYPFAEFHPQDRNESVIVRGIIDCFFETEKGIVIIDFKTDRIEKFQGSARAEFYTPQLLLYRRAVETILARPVAEMHLYFLTPGVGVAVPFN